MPYVMKIRAGVVAITCLLAAAAPAFAFELAGIWYGRGQPDDPDVVSLVELKADGTFRSEFRKYDKCKLLWRQTETGTWTAEGASQHFVVQTVDDRPVHIDEFYTTDMLSNTEQHVRLADEAFMFMEHRVAAFEFPDCLTS